MGKVIRLILSPRGCLPLSRCYIHVEKHKKICIKTELKETFFNLQQMVKVKRPFYWHQTFDAKGLSAPAPGLYTCGKTLKNVYKIRFLFLNLQRMGKVIRAFC